MHLGTHLQRARFGVRLSGVAAAVSLAACSAAGSAVPSPGTAALSKATAQERSSAAQTPTALKKGYTVLYSFAGSPDGGAPFGGVILDNHGNIFGTTYAAGLNSDGIIFELTPAGSGYAETVLHSFDGTDGNGPVANPIEDADGNLFVTTIEGGGYGGGTAIELSPGKGGYDEAALYSFGNGADGATPDAAFLAAKSTLYTTTASGGKNGAGAIVAVSANGLSETDVYDFKNGSDGAYPLSNLVADSTGALYGTTVAGGSAGEGTVFKFVPSQKGGTETVLWSFQSNSPDDGAAPNGGVVLDAKGDIYGTTTAGGGTGDGVVYALKASGGKYTENILHAFAGGSDGAKPVAGLAMRGKLLYGTTSSGSGSLCVSCGTLFRVGVTGKEYEILHTFEGSDGANPLAPLFLSGNALYGTTSNGGANSLGVVFRLVL